jgi:hypothetical protein
MKNDKYNYGKKTKNYNFVADDYLWFCMPHNY